MFDSTLVSDCIGLYGEIVDGTNYLADAAKAYELHALLNPLLSAHRTFSIIGHMCHPRRVRTKTESVDNKGAPNR